MDICNNGTYMRQGKTNQYYLCVEKGCLLVLYLVCRIELRALPSRSQRWKRVPNRDLHLALPSNCGEASGPITRDLGLRMIVGQRG